MASKPRKTSKRWVESGPLEAWMKQYVRWLAGFPGAELTGAGQNGYRVRYPLGEVRAAKASFFAHRVVHVELTRKLEKRPDVREYFAKLRDDTAYQAKEMARDQVARNFEAREVGLELAVEAKDHKAIEHYTRPFVEHGMPKKEEKAPQVQRFTINLIGASPEQRKLLESAFLKEPVDEVDYEVVENPKLLTDGEDE